jgi:hypothetical protein
MSQIFKTLTSGGPIPPIIVSTLTGDDGVATAAGNNINVPGGSTSDINSNGIHTLGAGDTLTIQLTNRAFGSATTAGLVTTTVATFTPSPTTEGVYKMFVEVCAWIDATQTASTYEMSGAFKCDGAGGFATIGTPIRIMNGENPPFDVNQVDIQVLAGNVNLVATGIAGQTISWTGLITFLFGGP